ncbi:MAG: RtcB family protein [Anaerolineales bacterium]|nr:RtcB family protein [Anaerolineales bacterium]
MIRKQDFTRITDYLWELPVSFKPEMNVPVRVFADSRILEDALKDDSIVQAVNAAGLPGLVSHMTVMPDVHQGYGFPIGGVAASRFPDGVISPGGIGYDINCGVRLLASRIPSDALAPVVEDLKYGLYAACPSGVGKGGRLQLRDKELTAVCRDGAEWTRHKGFATDADLAATEDSGKLAGADPADLSPRARKRGLPQLGTLGGGNHFIEVERVEEIYDEQAAAVMGLVKGCLTLQIHCGSRGLGHQVCSDTVRAYQDVPRRYGYTLPDRELACAPLDSPEGKLYLSAMACAANYAFANRQILASYAREVFDLVFAGRVQDRELIQVYDLAHNIGKMETHEVAGKSVRVCVHRKGATRAFGPRNKVLPARYQGVGQPVLVPGSMGTASWVLVGQQDSMELSFGSSCHGSGRVKSRKEAKRSIRGDQLLKNLQAKGIAVQAGSMPGLAEEAPDAYKDVDAVVNVVHQAGIARKVARLRPLVVIKG